mgnify:CR=1 FL=1
MEKINSKIILYLLVGILILLLGKLTIDIANDLDELSRIMEYPLPNE